MKQFLDEVVDARPARDAACAVRHAWLEPIRVVETVSSGKEEE